MMYSIRYKSKAKIELHESFSTYGATYQEEMTRWLQRIAGGAADETNVSSIDYLVVLEEGVTKNDQWKYSWKMWWEKTNTRERIAAIIHILKKWCPPYQHAMTCHWIPLLGTTVVEVHAYYLLDHVAKEIIFVKFDGLPGQT